MLNIQTAYAACSCWEQFVSMPAEKCQFAYEAHAAVWDFDFSTKCSEKWQPNRINWDRRSALNCSTLLALAASCSPANLCGSMAVVLLSRLVAKFRRSPPHGHNSTYPWATHCARRAATQHVRILSKRTVLQLRVIYRLSMCACLSQQSDVCCATARQ